MKIGVRMYLAPILFDLKGSAKTLTLLNFTE